MSQLHRLEADKSLIIYYHPFGYELLPDAEEWIVKEGKEELTLIEGNECEMVVDQNVKECDIYPIYVLWPLSHPIPRELNYECLYDAYLPENQLRDLPDPQPVPHYSGYLSAYDNRLGQYKPIGTVQLEYKESDGTTQFSSTDDDGYFFLPFGDPDYPLIINLRNDKFIIRDGATSNVKSIALNLNLSYSPDLNNNYDVTLPTNFFLDTYKAAEYYFYGQNDVLDIIPIYDTLGISIDIHAIDEPSAEDYLGLFNYSSTPYINIWNAYKNNYTGASSKIFGTVNHELTHASNYAYAGYSNYSITLPRIKESFASFVGWYAVLQYYSYYIGTNQYFTNNICTQGRQTWTRYISSPSIHYTPIYVDLFDDYNQHIMIGSAYNDDPISGVPVSFIVSSALGPMTFQSVYTILQSGIGLYYTSSEFATFIAPYSIFL